jgi:hypothetical protein
MRGRINSALATDDGETRLMLWGASGDQDAGEPETWRSASPYWSTDREQMIRAKYTKALAGEVDPEADDLDPMQGFLAQYLNVWRLRPRTRTVKGEPVVTEDTWSSHVLPPPLEDPTCAAIESWYADGVSLVLAWRTDNRVVVSASDHTTVDHAVEALRESGHTGQVMVGKSLAGDPAFKGLRVKPMAMRTSAAAQTLGRLIGEGLAHDGGAHLTDQVLALRVLPGADGPRMASQHRADAVKATVWAVEAARSRVGKPRIVLPRVAQ